MSSRTRLLLALVLTVLLSSLLLSGGCQAKNDVSDDTAEPVATPEPAPAPVEEDGLYTPEYQPNGKETAVIKTNRGDITVQLYGNDAPLHVGNFVELARKGFYNDTKFHRYIAGFVVQGGDPNTRAVTAEEVAAEAAKPEGSGKFGVGDPGYRIKGEFDLKTNPRRHVKGALGMARGNDPDSAGSQFYFALEPLQQLDGSYTVFGQITGGMDVMEALRPGDTIESIVISNANG